MILSILVGKQLFRQLAVYALLGYAFLSLLETNLQALADDTRNTANQQRQDPFERLKSMYAPSKYAEVKPGAQLRQANNLKQKRSSQTARPSAQNEVGSDKTTTAEINRPAHALIHANSRPHPRTQKSDNSKVFESLQKMYSPRRAQTREVQPPAYVRNGSTNSPTDRSAKPRSPAKQESHSLSPPAAPLPSQSTIQTNDPTRLLIAANTDEKANSNSRVVVSRESTGSVPAANSTDDSLVVTRESKGTSPPPSPEGDSLVVPRETSGAAVPPHPGSDSLVVPREQEGSSVPINPTQDSLVVSRESEHSGSHKKAHSLVVPRKDSAPTSASNDLVAPRPGFSVSYPGAAAAHEQKFKAPEIHFFSQDKSAAGSNTGTDIDSPTKMQQDSFSSIEPLAGLPLSFPTPPLSTSGTTPTSSTEQNAQQASTQAATPEMARMKVLEERLFSRSFNQDNAQDRISRLERFVLGVEGKGEISERLDKLNKIFKAVTSSPASSTTDNTTGVSGKAAAKPKALLAVINDGIDNYNKHRFHNAEDDFNDALALAPGMSRVHAYLGVTLLQINQRQAALDAMNAAYELDPFGTYGRYAKQCLITLMGDEEVRKRGPRDDLKTVEKTLNSVNHQADTDSNCYRREGNIQADHMRFTIRDSNWAGNELGIRRDYIHTDWTVQSTRMRQDAAKRAEYAQESANNLKMLLSTKSMPGDAKLRALGTTLHARYYGDETYNLAPYYIPREAPMELKAQSLSLKSMRTAAAPSLANKSIRKGVPQKGSRYSKQNRR